jgi:hypothetical protein
MSLSSKIVAPMRPESASPPLAYTFLLLAPRPSEQIVAFEVAIVLFHDAARCLGMIQPRCDGWDGFKLLRVQQTFHCAAV